MTDVDTKLEDLTAISSLASGDVFYVLDVSDTTEGAGGTNKKVTKTNLGFASSGANSDITSLTGLTTALTVAQGGTGATSLTDGGLLLGSGTGAITALGVATNGQLPIGDGTTDPQLATLTSGNAITITNAAASITIAADAASLTADGVVELATSAEINTGTDTGRAIPVDQFVASNRNVRYVIVRVLGSATSATAATTVSGDFEFPFTGTITAVGAYNDTAGTTGTATYDINLGGSTIMTTNKISIETGEKSSRDAGTAPALTTTAITAGNIITFDIDTAQSGTEALGLSFRLEVRLT